MKMRWMSITFLGICMIVGLSTALLSHSVEAALTLPLSIRIGPVATTPAKSAPVSPPGTVRPVMPSTPTAGAVTILAQDSFKRANQIFWGTATDGKQWIGDANSIEVFSIVGNAGQVDHAQGTFNAILGPAATDSEVVFSGVVNQFAAGASINMGAVLRWTDNNNWYKALINGSNLQILRHVKGTTTSLGSVPFSAQGGVTYTLRFQGHWRSALRQGLAEQSARTKRLDVDCNGYHVVKRLRRPAIPGANRFGYQDYFISRDNSAGHDLAYPS